MIPAGTRNHFARDLGLDITNPASAVTALRAGDLALVDLGRVGSRVFVNNVSFGPYADALLTPGYREAKARTLAKNAPGYLGGQQWSRRHCGHTTRPSRISPDGPRVQQPVPHLDPAIPRPPLRPRHRPPRWHRAQASRRWPPPDLLPAFTANCSGRARRGHPVKESSPGQPPASHCTARRRDYQPASTVKPCCWNSRSYARYPRALQVLLPHQRPGIPTYSTGGGKVQATAMRTAKGRA